MLIKKYFLHYLYSLKMPSAVAVYLVIVYCIEQPKVPEHNLQFTQIAQISRKLSGPTYVPTYLPSQYTTSTYTKFYVCTQSYVRYVRMYLT